LTGEILLGKKNHFLRVIFERVNFIRPAGEMDSTGMALGNSPDKVSPGIHQNNR
jgi:hypothetical protein